MRSRPGSAPGPGEHLQTVDQLLAGLDGDSARDIRSQLASAVADLEQIALGLFPATLGSRPVGVLVREIAAGSPTESRWQAASCPSSADR